MAIRNDDNSHRYYKNLYTKVELTISINHWKLCIETTENSALLYSIEYNYFQTAFGKHVDSCEIDKVICRVVPPRFGMK